MLQSQVNYWNYVEQKRHNLATEAAGFQQAEASLISAKASERQSIIAEKLEPFEEMKARASSAQAEASLQQAQAALENAATNRGNLDVNRLNAAVNQQNATTNARNAAVNERNAETNAWNAAINEENAVTNRINAYTNQFEAQTHYEKAQSDISLNTAKERHEYADTRLTSAKIPEQQEKNVQATITTQYMPAEKTVSLVDTGTHALSNVTSSIRNITGAIRDVIGQKGNSNSNNLPSANQTNAVQSGFNTVMSLSDFIDDTAGAANKWAAKNILGKIVSANVFQ